MRRILFREIQAVCQESYQSQGLTRRDGGTFRSVDGDRGKFEFQLQCYGRETCAKGYPVIKKTDGPHKRTIWYTEKQLFKPLERRLPQSQSQEENAKSGTADAQNEDLVSGLVEEGWRSILSDAISSETFGKLDVFLKEERASGAIIYPPQADIFSAFNLCPFEETKVVIVGQVSFLPLLYPDIAIHITLMIAYNFQRILIMVPVKGMVSRFRFQMA